MPWRQPAADVPGASAALSAVADHLFVGRKLIVAAGSLTSEGGPAWVSSPRSWQARALQAEDTHTVSVLVVIAAVTAATMVVAALLGCLWCQKRRRLDPEGQALCRKWRKMSSPKVVDVGYDPALLQVNSAFGENPKPAAGAADMISVAIREFRDELQISDIQISGIIAEGGYGKVYRGVWRGLQVAIKSVLFQEGPGDDNSWASAVSEASIACNLHHPNIVTTFHHELREIPITHANEFRSCKLFLVQELSNGGTLEALMVSNAWRSADLWVHLERVTSVLLDVARGLQYMHSIRVFHGDLNPSNVMLFLNQGDADGNKWWSEDAQAVARCLDAGKCTGKITDFGLSKKLTLGKRHASNMMHGTPFYCAPELVAERRLQCESDVYSFGVVMWGLMHGCQPYVCRDGLFERHPRFPCFQQATPMAYAMLALECMAIDPTQRPTIVDIVDVLQGMREDVSARQYVDTLGYLQVAAGGDSMPTELLSGTSGHRTPWSGPPPSTGGAASTPFYTGPSATSSTRVAPPLSPPRVSLAELCPDDAWCSPERVHAAASSLASGVLASGASGLSGGVDGAHLRSRLSRLLSAARRSRSGSRDRDRRTTCSFSLSEERPRVVSGAPSTTSGGVSEPTLNHGQIDQLRAAGGAPPRQPLTDPSDAVRGLPAESGSEGSASPDAMLGSLEALPFAWQPRAAIDVPRSRATASTLSYIFTDASSTALPPDAAVRGADAAWLEHARGVAPSGGGGGWPGESWVERVRTLQARESGSSGGSLHVHTRRPLPETPAWPDSARLGRDASARRHPAAGAPRSGLRHVVHADSSDDSAGRRGDSSGRSAPRVSTCSVVDRRSRSSDGRRRASDDMAFHSAFSIMSPYPTSPVLSAPLSAHPQLDASTSLDYVPGNSSPLHAPLDVTLQQAPSQPAPPPPQTSPRPPPPTPARASPKLPSPNKPGHRHSSDSAMSRGHGAVTVRTLKPPQCASKPPEAVDGPRSVASTQAAGVEDGCTSARDPPLSARTIDEAAVDDVDVVGVGVGARLRGRRSDATSIDSLTLSMLSLLTASQPPAADGAAQRGAHHERAVAASTLRQLPQAAVGAAGDGSQAPGERLPAPAGTTSPGVRSGGQRAPTDCSAPATPSAAGKLVPRPTPAAARVSTALAVQQPSCSAPLGVQSAKVQGSAAPLAATARSLLRSLSDLSTAAQLLDDEARRLDAARATPPPPPTSTTRPPLRPNTAPLFDLPPRPCAVPRLPLPPPPPPSRTAQFSGTPLSPVPSSESDDTGSTLRATHRLLRGGRSRSTSRESVDRATARRGRALDSGAWGGDESADHSADSTRTLRLTSPGARVMWRALNDSLEHHVDPRTTGFLFSPAVSESRRTDVSAGSDDALLTQSDTASCSAAAAALSGAGLSPHSAAVQMGNRWVPRLDA